MMFIIELAKKAGIFPIRNDGEKQLELFAALIEAEYKDEVEAEWADLDAALKRCRAEVETEWIETNKELANEIIVKNKALKLAKESLESLPEMCGVEEALAAIREVLAEPVKRAAESSGSEVSLETEAQEPVAIVDETAPGLVNWTTWKLPEQGTKLYAAPIDVKAIRAEALEEAAKVCEDIPHNPDYLFGTDYAAAIRGLK